MTTTKIRGDVVFLGTVTGVTATGTTESQGDITLAVSTTGSDTPSVDRPAHIVSGDYTAYPFLTIQAAIDALPAIDRYSSASIDGVYINVGAGNFAGFMVNGFNFANMLRITGTRQTSTPATGPSSGTATGGGTRLLTLTGAGWTVDDLVGRYLNITSGTGAGQILLIAENDADNIWLADPGSPSPAAGSVFTIEDLATNIDTESARATACGFYDVGIEFYQNYGWVEVRDVKITAATTFGYQGDSNQHASVRRVVVDGSYYGFYEQYTISTYFTQIGALNAGYSGINVYDVYDAFPYSRGWLAKGCAYYGVYIQLSGGPRHTGIYVRNAAGSWGVTLLQCPAGPKLYNVLVDGASTGISSQASLFGLRITEIKNSTVGCFYLFMTQLYIESSLVGTGNAGWGLYAVGTGNTVQITGFNPTISGSSGQVTVDGTTDVTWASLASVGSYALDMATGARVNRQ
jgi:hypothetical protein